MTDSFPVFTSLVKMGTISSLLGIEFLLDLKRNVLCLGEHLLNEPPSRKAHWPIYQEIGCKRNQGLVVKLLYKVENLHRHRHTDTHTHTIIITNIIIMIWTEIWPQTHILPSYSTCCSCPQIHHSCHQYVLEGLGICLIHLNKWVCYFLL